MSFPGMMVGWFILSLMALVYEYGDRWQATNAQLVALGIVIVLNIMVIHQLLCFAASRLRHHEAGSRH